MDSFLSNISSCPQHLAGSLQWLSLGRSCLGVVPVVHQMALVGVVDPEIQYFSRSDFEAPAAASSVGCLVLSCNLFHSILLLPGSSVAMHSSNQGPSVSESCLVVSLLSFFSLKSLVALAEYQKPYALAVSQSRTRDLQIHTVVGCANQHTTRRRGTWKYCKCAPTYLHYKQEI